MEPNGKNKAKSNKNPCAAYNRFQVSHHSFLTQGSNKHVRPLRINAFSFCGFSPVLLPPPLQVTLLL
jgi:hypothetical protein